MPTDTSDARLKHILLKTKGEAGGFSRWLDEKTRRVEGGEEIWAAVMDRIHGLVDENLDLLAERAEWIELVKLMEWEDQLHAGYPLDRKCELYRKLMGEPDGS